jgi:hypothetical protein
MVGIKSQYVLVRELNNRISPIEKAMKTGK